VCGCVVKEPLGDRGEGWFWGIENFCIENLFYRKQDLNNDWIYMCYERKNLIFYYRLYGRIT
jgi:hypothetical protein